MGRVPQVIYNENDKKVSSIRLSVLCSAVFMLRSVSVACNGLSDVAVPYQQSICKYIQFANDCLRDCRRSEFLPIALL